MAKGDVNKITMLLFYYKWAMISHYYSTEIKSFYSNKFPTSVFTVDNFKQSNVYSMFTLGTKEKWLHKTIDSLYIFCLDFGTVLMM
jgi:hypothetical protein